MKPSVKASAVKDKTAVRGVKPLAKIAADSKKGSRAVILPAQEKSGKKTAATKVVINIYRSSGEMPGKVARHVTVIPGKSSKTIHAAGPKTTVVKGRTKTADAKTMKGKTAQEKAGTRIETRVSATLLISSSANKISRPELTPSRSKNQITPALSKSMLQKRQAAKSATRKQGGVKMKELPARKIKSLIRANSKEAGPAKVD